MEKRGHTPRTHHKSAHREREESHGARTKREEILREEEELLRNLKLNKGPSNTAKANPSKHASTIKSKPHPETDHSGKSKPHTPKATPVVTKPKPQESARTIANSITTATKHSKTKALNLACEDLSDVFRRGRRPDGKKMNDKEMERIRQTILTRIDDLKARLPRDLRWLASTAFMHIDHGRLRRNYVNTETMYGDAIPDISRANFWVSEDGCAWDMEELSQAIDSNNGVMRNPLSKHLFTPDDLKAIVRHPLGSRLAAMEISQRSLRQGVRPETISRLGRLARLLLDDDEETEFLPSRRAVEGFRTHVATLPAGEQDAVERLRVPAVDTHTGIPFDTSIGGALRDALANEVCFHKTGDLLYQAARWLDR